ncbi:MAG: fimbria/pilus outer membrane usher protein [Pseudomonadota bacterium]
MRFSCANAARIGWCLLLMGLAGGALASLSDSATGRAELLAVRINEVDQPTDVLAVRLPAHRIAVPFAALAAWRLRAPDAPSLRIDGHDHVDLARISGLHWRIDDASQTLVMQVPAAAFLRNDFEVVSPLRPAQAVAGLGGFVNYDFYWQRETSNAGGERHAVGGGLIEIGAFNPWGNGRSSGVWRRAGSSNGYTRLDTSWNVDMPDTLSSLRVGDAIGAGGAWGRSVRFGGVQWATNFAVQPGLVSFPMPAVRGEASMPSVVDLYVNGTHQLQGKVPPGAFDLPHMPVVTGAGQIKMVVRDLLGREQVIVSPYYVSPALLREGLHDFAVELGAVRKDYGLESLHYGRAMLVATDRQGLDDRFTRELRAELLRDQQTVGIGGVWLVRNAATVNAAVAASRGPVGAGWLAVVGVDHRGADWSAGIQAQRASRHFAQVGQAEPGPGADAGRNVRSSINANFAASVGGGGVAINLLQQATWDGHALRTLSLNYSRAVGWLGHLSLYASRTTGTATGTTIGINLIQSLGGNASASASSWRSREKNPDAPGSAHAPEQHVVQVQGTAPVGPGFGYQLLVERGSYQRHSADLTWQSEAMAFGLGAAAGRNGAAQRASLSGAIALMPEGVFASRRIEGSFAVVQVGDYEGVRVSRDNHLVSRTDHRGRALVTGLRGFESNRISVDGQDLPLDAEVDDLHVAVVPGMGSGVSVRFPVRRTRAATLRLVTRDGQPVPPGSAVRIGDGPQQFPVGFEGRVFLAGLAERSTFSATWPGQDCRGEIVLEQGADSVPELGTVLCR